MQCPCSIGRTEALRSADFSASMPAINVCDSGGDVSDALCPFEVQAASSTRRSTAWRHGQPGRREALTPIMLRMVHAATCWMLYSVLPGYRSETPIIKLTPDKCMRRTPLESLAAADLSMWTQGSVQVRWSGCGRMRSSRTVVDSRERSMLNAIPARFLCASLTPAAKCSEKREF